MSSSQLDSVIARFGVMKSRWNADTTLDRMRADLDDLHASFAPAFAFRAQAVTLGGVPCEWVSVPGADEARTLAYFHGGGFSTGSVRATRNLAAFLSRASAARVLVVGYRLAPEHPFPAPVDDGLRVIEALCAGGAGGRQLALGGDSAGGGLVLVLLAECVRRGLAMPAAAILLTPWADLRCTAGSYASLRDRDPIASREMAQMMAQMYLDGASPHDHRASPVLGSFAGLPPLLIQAGGRDVFLDDARAATAGAQAAGVEVHCDLWPDMIHQWQLYASVLDEAREAIDVLGRFLQERYAS
ncbi:alpha/beta hydrolase [Sinimarinibacterium flocculans]|uniref:alpha/beta hydrolase n=1 Tax=Sinimarinibacterium flocculans TaxID=985250 RepID=UPI0024938C5E|nr:alpha/beta hydrolase [Sinimarinibacterium flocculans]